MGIAHWCIGSVIGLSAVVAPAAAQGMKDVTPYSAVVTSDNASIRCGAGMYYRVTELPKGRTVQIDGEDGQFARITYPAGTAAFVRARDSAGGEVARADEAAGTVKLTAENQLMAMNAAGGFDVSWKGLFEKPIAAGTSLKLLETVKKDGTVVGYKVVAPANAKGFVELKALRRAGDAGPPTVPAAPEIKPQPPIQPQPRPADPAAPRPATPDNPLLQPINTNPATPVIPGPTGAAEPGTPKAVAPQPLLRRIGSLDELEAAFQQVRKQPAAEAEYGALIAEFERAIGQVNATDGGRKRQLERRRDALTIQSELRDKQQALERTKKEIDESSKRVSTRLAELERQRVYTIIGLLVPSTVYDGKNLPLMYRLQAVGITAPPTIGYLAPKPELQLETKLGMVVGVVGESTIDRALSLNVIDPIRVDVLQAVDGKDVTPPTPPPAQPSAAAPTPAGTTPGQPTAAAPTTEK